MQYFNANNLTYFIGFGLAFTFFRTVIQCKERKAD